MDRALDRAALAAATLQPASRFSKLIVAVGGDFSRRHNVKSLINGCVVFITGNTVAIYDVARNATRFIFGHDGGGIGAVAVHPSQLLFAVAEKCNPAPRSGEAHGPRIYVYGYPSLALVKTLEGGTERAYSDISFSSKGNKLVSVGSFPDFMLAVWDWEAATIVLATKAFSQEVFNARFVPEDDGRLITSGTGHVRFWRMASTFTGLKLQGDIGKFGKIDLSDVSDFAQLPDGKVVTTSESGYLMLWEGHLIKCLIGRAVPVSDGGGGGGGGGTAASAQNPAPAAHESSGVGSSPSKALVPGLLLSHASLLSASTQLEEPVTHDLAPAHDGPIHVVQLELGMGIMLTAGGDGVLRWWDVRDVDGADTTDEFPIPAFLPLAEVSLPTPPHRVAHINGITRFSVEDVPQAPEEPHTSARLTARVPALKLGGPVASTAALHAAPITHHRERVVTWIVQEATAGELWRVTMSVVGITAQRKAGAAVVTTEVTLRSCACIYRGHAGSLVGAAVLAGGIVATAGADGAIKAWDVAGRAVRGTAGFTTIVPAHLANGSGQSKDANESKTAEGQERDEAASERKADEPAAALPTQALTPVLATALCSIPAALDAATNSVLVGFVDGVVRVLRHAAAEGVGVWAAEFVSKPHTAAVTAVSFCETGKLLATGSKDGTVFLFACTSAAASGGTSSFSPIGFVQLGAPGSKCDVTALALAPAGDCLFAGCSDGTIFVVALPAAMEEYPRSSHTFALPLPVASYQVHVQLRAKGKPAEPPMPPKGTRGTRSAYSLPSPDGEAKADDADAAAAAAAPAPVADVITDVAVGPVTALFVVTATTYGKTGDATVLVGTAGPGGHLLYECSIPLVAYSAGKVIASEPAALTATAAYPLSPASLGEGSQQPHVTCISRSQGGHYLLVGASNGAVYVRPMAQLAIGLRLQLHDSGFGAVRGVCTVNGSDATVVSVAADGALMAVELDGDAIASAAADVTTGVTSRLSRPCPIDTELDAPQPPDRERPPQPAQQEQPAPAPAPAPDVPRVDAADVAIRTVDASAPGLQALSVHDATAMASDAYSLEQDRQRSEADAQQRSAEVEKAKVRRVVAELRAAFARLRSRIAAEATVHPSRAVPESELVLDAELVAQLQADGQARLTEVDAEYEYDRARSQTQLSKLVQRFLADVETDEVLVHAIRSPALSVATLRTQVLSAALAAAQMEMLAASQQPATRSSPYFLLSPNYSDSMASPSAAGSPDALVDAAASDTAMQFQQLSVFSPPAESITVHSAFLRRTGSAFSAATSGALDVALGDAEAVIIDSSSIAAGEQAAGPLDDAARSTLSMEEGAQSDGEDGKGMEGLSAVATATGQQPARGAGAQGSFEERRALRLARKVAIDALQAKRPGPSDEHPDDVVAVAYAQQNMGDYRLKTSADYRPPEGRRVDATTKRQQMVELELHVHSIRGGFNARVLAMKRRRTAVLRALQAAEAEVAAIDAELARGATAKTLEALGIVPALPASLLQPEVATFVAPEVSGDPLDAPELTDLISACQPSGAPTPAAPGTVPDALSASVPGPFLQAADPFALLLDPEYRHHRSNGYLGSTASPAGRWAFRSPLVEVGAPATAVVMTLQPSQEEAEAAVLQFRVLCDRKAWLRGQEVAIIEGFDQDVGALRHERLRLDRDSTAAALRLLVLRQELDLLRDMAKRDAGLETRLNKSKNDKATMAAAISAFSAQLAEKRAELDALQAKDKALFGEVEEVVGVSHPAFSALVRIFKRKVKRKGRGGATGAGGKEDDADSDSELGDDVDEDEDDDEDGDVCPDNCDHALYERVLQLRERRLDIEDTIADVNRASDEIRKQSDRQSQREKTIDKEYSGISAELAAFQREKQARLNMIECVVVLRASQILCGKQPPPFAAGDADDGAPIGMLPASIDACALLTRKALRQLRERIAELDAENVTLEASFKDLHKNERRLLAEKRTLETEIYEARAAAEELQLLKFGRVIDIDSLDRTTGMSTATMTKVETDIGATELEHSVEVNALKERLAAEQQRLLEVTREHTAVLEAIATLTAKQTALEAHLSGRHELARLADTQAAALAMTSILSQQKPTGVALRGAPMNTKAARMVLAGLGGNRSSLARTAGMEGAAPRGARLSSATGILVNDSALASRLEVEERTRLMKVIQSQAQTMDAMRSEILMLRRKGGLLFSSVAPRTSTSASKAADALQSAPTPYAAQLAVGGTAVVMAMGTTPRTATAGGSSRSTAIRAHTSVSESTHSQHRHAAEPPPLPASSSQAQAAGVH